MLPHYDKDEGACVGPCLRAFPRFRLGILLGLFGEPLSSSITLLAR